MQKESNHESKDNQEFKKKYDYQKRPVWPVLIERYHHKEIKFEHHDITSKVFPLGFQKTQEGLSRSIKSHIDYFANLPPSTKVALKKLLLEKSKNNQSNDMQKSNNDTILKNGNNTMFQNAISTTFQNCNNIIKQNSDLFDINSPSFETKNRSDSFFDDDDFIFF